MSPLPLCLLPLLQPIKTVDEPWAATSLVINITINLNPQTIEFDAYRVMYCGDLTCEKYYLCPEPRWGLKKKQGWL
jgi:hypothetical protein